MEQFQLSEPFLGPEGDIILRSVDGINFHVFRVILEIASPFFRTLFSLPQPQIEVDGAAGPTDHHDLPVVDVGEDSTALDIALRYCYPVRKPQITDIAVVDRVLAAGLKYEIDVVVESMKSFLVTEEIMANQPIRAYFIACKHKLRDQAHVAAKATLAHSIFVFDGRELDEAPARHLLNLMKYRKIIASLLCEIFNRSGTRPEHAWNTPEDADISLLRPPCGGTPQIGCGHAANFWVHFLIRAVPLISEVPHTNAIFDDSFLRPISDVINECDLCRDSHAVRMWYKNLEGTIRGVYDRTADLVSSLTRFLIPMSFIKVVFRFTLDSMTARFIVRPLCA